MADNDYSSLRAAVDRILGKPPGGTQEADAGTGLAQSPSTNWGASGPTYGPESAIDLVPRMPFQSETLKTTSQIANTIPEAVADPFAAQLAEIQAKNTALSAQLAAKPATSYPAAALNTTSPAAVAPAPATTAPVTSSSYAPVNTTASYMVNPATGQSIAPGQVIFNPTASYMVNPLTGASIPPSVRT